MLELGVGADIVRGIGWLLWIAFALALLASLVRPKTARGKVFWSLLVLGIFSGPMLPSIYRNYEFKQRQTAAKALFEERCKAAGEKIYKTTSNVRGVFLLKVRRREGSDSDPMAPMAAAWNESTGTGYIHELLFSAAPSNNPYGYTIVQKETERSGFSYVEAIDPVDGKRYRHTWRPGKSSTKELSPSFSAPRYAIDYEDIVNAEDRKHWVASGLIRIVDLQDNSVMGEFLFHRFEADLGSRTGQRQPWAFARSCPGVPVVAPMHRFFADKVLRNGG